MGSDPETAGSLEADAFRRLYPNQFYASFLAKHTRPDGRSLMRSRPVSVAPNAVTSADSSATAKLGASAAIAGVKLEVAVPSEERSDEGSLAVAVEMAPMSSPDIRPGRPGEAAQCLAEQVSSILCAPDVVPRKQLCIENGRACWVVYLDILVLNADGSLLDVCLLAAWAALRTLHLPSVRLTAEGNVEPCADPAALSSTEGCVLWTWRCARNKNFPPNPAWQFQYTSVHAFSKDEVRTARQIALAIGLCQQCQHPAIWVCRRPCGPSCSCESEVMTGVWTGRSLQLSSQPVAQTCGMLEGRLICDCTAEEERLAATTITTTVDGQGDLLGLVKAGGTAEAGDLIIHQCMEAAKLRQQELSQMLDAQLETQSKR